MQIVSALKSYDNKHWLWLTFQKSMFIDSWKTVHDKTCSWILQSHETLDYLEYRVQRKFNLCQKIKQGLNRQSEGKSRSLLVKH